jgi:hypothetical protein
MARTNKEVKKEDSKKEKKVIEDEIFNIKKDGEEKTIRKEITEEDKPAPKEQIKKESKIFIGVVIVMASFVLMFLIGYIIINSINHFQEEGVKFQLIKMGKLAFYRTTLPVMYNNSKADYSFYLRTNPKVLVNVPFNGKIIAKKDMVIAMKDDFRCEGDGVIAAANLVKLYEFIGTKVVRNESFGCDPAGRYMYVNIKAGNETRIVQYGPICYDIEIKDCEILKGTEKFMFETFVEMNKKLAQTGQ